MKLETDILKTDYLVTGNLLRSGDVRGFQSMAKMYTRLAAMPKKG